MIASIHIKGLGPHEDTTLTLAGMGAADLTGDSEAGKSTAILACEWVLCGTRLDASLIRDDAPKDRAEVVVRFAKTTGTTALRRTQTRSGSLGYQVEKDGEWARMSSQRAYLQALGPIGADPQLTRLIMTPLAWRELHDGAGNGRPLRDFLERLTAPAEPRQRFAEIREAARQIWPECPKGAIMDLADAEQERREARKAAQQATGARKHAEVTLTSAKAAMPAVPTAADLKAARSTLLAADAWNAHKTWSVAADAVSNYASRLEALGKRPKAPKDTGATPLAAERQLDTDRDALAKARALVERIESTPVDQVPEVVEAESRIPSDGDTCPTCQRPGWEHAERAAIQAQEIREAVTARRAEALERAQTTLATAESRVKDSTLALGKAQQMEIARAWDRARAALGDPPPAAGEEPERPVVGCPSDLAAREARAILEAAKTAQDRADQQGLVVETAKEALAKTKAAEEATATQLALAERLVEVLREAPSRVLDKRLDDLNATMRGTRFALRGEGVVVLVDGRPFHLASAGRQRLADLELRAAVRTRARMGWLPIWIDQAQDWSGDWPTVKTAVFCWTQPGELAAVPRAAVKGAA